MVLAWPYIDETDERGNPVRIINPYLPSEEREEYEKQAKTEGSRIADPEEYPKIRGKILELELEENYPRIRWNFEWDKYVIIGVPDGITDKFVYEFKTTRNRFLMNYQKPVAHTQADLYGYFFRREQKRVQIHIVEEGKTETWEDKVNSTRAENLLNDFKRMNSGWTPPSPKMWKCKSCEFNSICPISKKFSKTTS